MRVRLSPAAHIVGIKREHFRALRRQEMLPKVDKILTDEVGDRLLDEADRGVIDSKWADYGLDELVPLRCMIALLAEGGLNPVDASNVVVNAWGKLDERFTGAKTLAEFENCLKGSEQWLGVEAAVDAEGGYFRSHYAGILPEIYMASEARAERNKLDFGGTRVRLILVSVSGAIRYVLSRAANLPIAEDE